MRELRRPEWHTLFKVERHGGGSAGAVLVVYGGPIMTTDAGKIALFLAAILTAFALTVDYGPLLYEVLR